MLPVFLLVFAAIASPVLGQFVNGRILEPPVPALCAQRKIHEKYGGKGYYFSWLEQSTKSLQEDWLGSRNFCRMRCMDVVSPDTKAENEWIKSKIVAGNQKYIWTSGRVCDFKGCDRPDLQPARVNGWFWTAELKKFDPNFNDWSSSGGLKVKQPDNREFKQGGPAENCLAILNNFYNDGVNWHDVACHHRKPIVCEENEALLKYVRATHPELKV
ncbi:hypothetical protein J437_LFUL012368 [Ladona fulva]|uniref:C-type lectin domain-containing protein n=1 Tax=Ladona fulva TaxID=123851 RepID=A0A8K0P6A6_LADFU|nr:hypothetical protein J437_LFUL012368 [Ladona fulva]